MIFVSSFTRADTVPIMCVGDDAATLKTKQKWKIERFNLLNKKKKCVSVVFQTKHWFVLTTSYIHKIKIKKCILNNIILNSLSETNLNCFSKKANPILPWKCIILFGI
jgi:hypothetical protein